MQFRSLASRGLPEVIAEQIVEAINTTPLGPGDRLPTEAELARQLGVGRTSVREALRKLQTLGIVEVVRGRGAFVAEPSPENAETEFSRWCIEQSVAIEELIETRLAIECATAGLAAAYADEAQIAELGRLNAVHTEAGLEGDVARLVASDQAFHTLIADIGGNPLLGKLHTMLDPELLAFRRMTLSLPHVAHRSAAAHQCIIDCIATSDAKAARTAMLEHLWVLYQDVSAAAGDSGIGVRRKSKYRIPPRAVFE